MQKSKPLVRSFISPIALVILLIALGLVSTLNQFVANAQDLIQYSIEPPDRKYLFYEDKLEKKVAQQVKRQPKRRAKSGLQKLTSTQVLPFDINALALSFDSAGNVLNAKGEVIITYSSLVAEAQEAQVNIPSNEASLIGDVRISDSTGNMTADSARINLENGSGTLENAEIYFDQGNYRLFAQKVYKDPGETYRLDDAVLTTCQCPEGNDCSPWSLAASEAQITRDGYGQVWNSTLRVQDIPVLYVPYLFFPAKNTRQSGFLPATYGGGRERGLKLEVPFFWAIDNSTDATITSLYESEVHYGADLEFRKIFSRSHTTELGVIYFDETMREDGNLLGVNTDGLYRDPDATSDKPFFGDHRYAGYLDHSWRSSDFELPLQLIVNGRYVSDVLFLREYEKEEIAHYNDRFVTSQAVLRMPLGDYYSADLSSEYNQALESNPDAVFQRLPELTLSGMNNFRPFGENPFGLKLVNSSNLSAVNFARDEGYEGSRSEVYDRLRLPFHFRNYFEGELEGNLRASYYDLSSSTGEDSPTEESGEDEDLGADIPGSSNRVVPGVRAKLNTVVEKVFRVEQDNYWKQVFELGKRGRDESLARLKHTFEPGIKYNFVPEVDQSDNPQFDSSDRLAQKSVMTYSLTQRLYGRYEPRNPYLYGIEETTPELQEMGNLRMDSPLDDRFSFGIPEELRGGDYQRLNRGSIAELATFRLSQSYDFLKENSDQGDSEEEPFSDIGADLTLYPNEYFGLGVGTDYDAKNSKFSAYNLEGQFFTKRGDIIRSQLSFVDGNNPVRQLESGIEFKVTDFVRLGYYARYDDVDGQFIEQKGGLRFYSACRCWRLDVGVSDKINPDETQFNVNVTLVGLGEVGNTFFKSLDKEDENNQKSLF